MPHGKATNRRTKFVRKAERRGEREYNPPTTNRERYEKYLRKLAGEGAFYTPPPIRTRRHSYF